MRIPIFDDPQAQRDGVRDLCHSPSRDCSPISSGWASIWSRADRATPTTTGRKASSTRCVTLDEAGIAHAGSGRHLAEARAPAYVETAQGASRSSPPPSQYKPGSKAGDQRYDTLGYPGVNGLRHKVVYGLDQPMLDELRKIGAAIGLDAAEDRRRFQGDPVSKRSEDSYSFLGRTFKVGPPGETSFVNENDLKENLRQVRNARAFADKVIVSLHCHDLGGPTLLTAKRRSEIADLADYAIDSVAARSRPAPTSSSVMDRRCRWRLSYTEASPCCTASGLSFFKLKP